MFSKILIANRGEIACRVIRTAQKLGVNTVSVFSDADRHSKHTMMSDERCHIGGPTPLESYLKMEAVLEAALKTNAQGIHPGYGFLSENPTFVDLCEKAGVKFIGPPSKAMIQMASKSRSKDIMINANVPVTPGYHGDNQDPKHLLEESKKIGFPVMIKAVMGGGGKGMKISHSPQDFMEQLESAKREAMKSFKDDVVLIEKYITRPKHYEVQVVGDSYGNYAYLFERDCSIQRRHQKIIEEAPSALTPAQRKDMGEKAVAAARAVGYVNAGTVEFLYDMDTKNFYFMEMNTRLQVEHPISEEITGVDLVEWQLKIASGQKLPKSQDQLSINGHALEARIYSEDPFTFLPGRGTIDFYKEPSNARVDSGVQLGSDVGIFYDPMISKLIVHGENRDIAVQKMRKALVDYNIGGLVTNIPFLKRVCDNKDFANFDYDLQFISQNYEELVPRGLHIDDWSLCSGIILQAFHPGKSHSNNLPSKLKNFRVNHNLCKTVKNIISHAHSQNEARMIASSTVTKTGESTFDVEISLLDEKGNPIGEISKKTFSDVRIGWGEDKVTVEIGGRQERLSYYCNQEAFFVFDFQGNCFRNENLLDNMVKQTGEKIDTERILSPMSGMVVKINAEEGKKFKKGEVVAIVEAMKMEHIVTAQMEIEVEKVFAKQGIFIEAGQPILKIKS